MVEARDPGNQERRMPCRYIREKERAFH